MDTKVLFLRGLQENYDAIQEYSAETFYYCVDSKNLYIGDQLITNSGDLVAAISRIAVNEGEISTIKTTLQTIQGESNVTGSIKNIVATEIAKIVAGADASLDTLKEIADWITDHADSAASMSSDIAALKLLVGTALPSGAESTNVIEYIGEAVEAGKYDPTDVTRSTKCLIIPKNAYKNSNLASADFPIAIAVEEHAFDASMSMTTMNLPLARTIGEGAFSSCINLTAVNLPSATYVGKDAFAMDMQVATINAPLLRVVGFGAFQNTNITKIDLPSAEIIEEAAFGGSFLCEEINVPLAYRIDMGAFQNAEKTESVTLPSIRELGPLVFYACTKLKEVIIPTIWVPKAGHDLFMNTAIDTADAVTGEYGTIYVRGELIEQYKVAEGWSTYADRFAPIPGTEVVAVLPSVTAADAGKVLKVDDNGNWGKGEDSIYWGTF